VAAALRLGFVAWAPRVPSADGRTYHGFAEVLMRGMGYVNPDGSPAIMWVPGWPLLLAGLYRVFGFDPTVGMVAGAILGALTAALLAALGARLFGPRAGLVAGAIYALWPGLVYYSATLYSEDLFNALLVGLLLLLGVTARAERRRGVGWAAAGLTLGAMAQVKAEPLALSPMLGVYLWCVRRSRADFARSAALLFGVTALVVSPWILRNYRLFDRFIPTSSSGGSVAWIGNHPGASGAFDGFADLHWAELHRREDRARTDLARDAAGWREVWRFARESPTEALAILPRKLRATYSGDGDGASIVRGFGGREHWQLPEGTWRWMLRVADAWWYGVVALAALGLTRLGRFAREARVLVLGPVLTWLVLHLVFIGGPRFHVPEAPSFALLAALGLGRLRSALGGPRVRRAAAAAALVALASSGCAPAPPRNLLLIVVDTLRADHLGCYGHARDTSPAIDALAAEGVRFERAYSPSSWTKPAVASLLTGLYPNAHGVTDVRHPLPDGVRTLAELLAARGWDTAAVVSNVQLTHRDGNGMGRGFRTYAELHAVGYDYVSTPGVTQQAVAMLRRMAAAEAPFFLLAHYFDPHANYRRHGIGYAPARAGRLDGTQPIETLQNELLASLAPAEVDFLRDLYDEEIRFTDAGIGRLLGALRELGRWDDTLVVVTGDHGEEFLERGWLGHVRSLYDELVRVPLIVRDPGAAGAPRVVSTPVSLVSLTPTLLERLGIDAPLDFDAPSLAPVLRDGTEPSAGPHFAEVSYVPLALPFSVKRTFKRAVVAGRFKLIEDVESGRRELYDLDADPGERADRLLADEAVAGELGALLARFAERGHGEPAALRELGEDEAELLRELGYLDP
jgi:arylsulfatase A-like enzyme